MEACAGCTDREHAVEEVLVGIGDGERDGRWLVRVVVGGPGDLVGCAEYPIKVDQLR